MHAVERPALSVVATTDHQSFVDELEHALGHDVDLIVVSTRPLNVVRARALEVFELESSYRRNRGLLLASAPVVAFLEDRQLPPRDWPETVARAFVTDPPPAAAVGGGIAAYDRRRLLTAHGFPLFTGAPPGSPVPDVLVLQRLRSEGERVAALTLAGQAPPRVRDVRRVGRALRINRKLMSLVRESAEIVRRGARRELFDLLAGAIVDRGWPFEAPAAARLTAAISAAVDARPLVSLAVGHKGKLHFLYRAEELMVHLYVGPTDHLRKAVTARKAMNVPGIPRLHAVGESVDALWIVEDFVSGTPIERERLRDPEGVGGWVVRLGGPPGPPLAAVESWRVHTGELLGAGFPEDAMERLRRSLETVKGVAARHLHGDLNPRNVLVDGDQLIAVDWENASLEFIPGLDLVFLFLLASGRPDERVILDSGRLAPQLQELGLNAELLPHALRVMLATWALGERERRARLGVDPGPVVFEPLFLRCERLLG